MNQGTNSAQFGDASPVNDAEDSIVIRFSYDRKLFRRALTGWWQSAVPPVPFLTRAITWAFAWFVLGILSMALWAWGLSPWYVGAGMIGAASIFALFGVLQRTRMSSFHDVIGAHWDKAGVTVGTFTKSGVVFEDNVSRQELDWAAIDAIRGMRGVTVVRTAFQMIAIPDAAMPEGMTASQFRARLSDWKNTT